MALVRTDLLGAISGASGNHGAGAYTTGAFTPPDNSLLVVAVSLIENGGSDSPLTDLTISGGSLTFSPQASAANAAGFTAATRIYTAPVTTGASMTLTLDCGARSIGEYSVSVVAYTGHNTGSPVGATATGAQNGGYGSAPNPVTLTLSGTPASSSEVFAAVGACKTVADTTPGATFAERHDVHNTDWGGLESETRTGSTSTTADWVDLRPGGGALFSHAAVAVEIKAATGISQAIGTATETDTAVALGRLKSRALGVASTTETAVPLGRIKTRALGVAVETDEAVPLGGSAVFPPLAVHVGQPRSPWNVGQPRSPWHVGEPR